VPEVCILLAAERSGTHFFRSLLWQVPGVFAPGEICNAADTVGRVSDVSFLRFRENACLSDHNFFYPTDLIQSEMIDEYLSSIRLLDAGRSHVLLDVKYSHVHNFNSFWWDSVTRPFLLEYVSKNQIKVIHLVRERPYRTVISSMYARKSGVWRTQSPSDIRLLKIRIERARLQEAALRLVKAINLFTEWLEACKTLKISYESLTANPESCLTEVQHFLNLKTKIPARSDFIRTTPPYEQAIENFSEISDLIDIGLSGVMRGSW
jgi:hypothetical protein